MIGTPTMEAQGDLTDASSLSTVSFGLPTISSHSFKSNHSSQLGPPVDIPSQSFKSNAASVPDNLRVLVSNQVAETVAENEKACPANLPVPPGSSAIKKASHLAGDPEAYRHFVSSGPGSLMKSKGAFAELASRFRYTPPGTYKARPAGGWKTAPFIFGSELAERLGSSSTTFFLVLYLMYVMNLPLAPAVKLTSAFFGASSLSPLLGAFLADAYLGRFTTIAVGSVFYLAGLLVFTVSSTATGLRPPQCTLIQEYLHACTKPSSYQLGILYLALFLQVIGSGGVRPCVAPFGADQFDETIPKHQKQIQHFFNWYYVTMIFAMALSLTVIIWIQTNVGWGWGSGIPSLAMGLSLIVFLGGARSYRYTPVTGSPLTSLAQVLVAAYRKRNLRLPESPNLMYRVKVPGSNQEERLLHTDSLKFLDKAAILDEGAGPHNEKSASPWMLCTVQQVEELKLLIRMFPIWTCSVALAVVILQSLSIMTKQATTMHLRLSKHFEVPAASMGAIGFLTLVVFIPLYDLFLISLFRKWTGHPRGLSHLQRVGVGFFFGIVAMVVGAVTEMKRRQTAIDSHMVDMLHTEHLPMSAFWLAPQYIVGGISESFVMPGMLEFLYNEGPVKLRSMTNAFLWAALGCGGLLSTLLYSIVQTATRNAKEGDWLQDNINTGHLDYFYIMLAALEAVTFVAFVFFSHSYVYKAQQSEEEYPQEFASDRGISTVEGMDSL